MNPYMDDEYWERRYHTSARDEYDEPDGCEATDSEYDHMADIYERGIYGD